MTVQRTESELRKAQAVKGARALIRLKHSLLADEELNAIIPELERRFDTSLQKGMLPDPAELARELVTE
jgi:hypothetical protein